MGSWYDASSEQRSLLPKAFVTTVAKFLWDSVRSACFSCRGRGEFRTVGLRLRRILVVLRQRVLERISENGGAASSVRLGVARPIGRRDSISKIMTIIIITCLPAPPTPPTSASRFEKAVAQVAACLLCSSATSARGLCRDDRRPARQRRLSLRGNHARRLGRRVAALAAGTFSVPDSSRCCFGSGLPQKERPRCRSARARAAHSWPSHSFHGRKVTPGRDTLSMAGRSLLNHSFHGKTVAHGRTVTPGRTTLSMAGRSLRATLSMAGRSLLAEPPFPWQDGHSEPLFPWQDGHS